MIIQFPDTIQQHHHAVLIRMANAKNGTVDDYEDIPFYLNPDDWQFLIARGYVVRVPRKWGLKPRYQITDAGRKIVLHWWERRGGAK